MSDPTTPAGKRLAALPAPGPGVRWPDAIIAIEQEAAAANEADSRTVAMYAANEAANRYKADADRLSAALRELLEDAEDIGLDEMRTEFASEALRQHDAAKEAERE